MEDTSSGHQVLDPLEMVFAAQNQDLEALGVVQKMDMDLEVALGADLRLVVVFGARSHSEQRRLSATVGVPWVKSGSKH